jgi:phosphoribosylglycinamide formyltransferase-1
MIHRVTPELDAGPAVTYCTFSLRGEKFDRLWKKMEEKLKTRKLNKIQQEEGEREPLFLAIREEQKKRELPLILATLELFARGEIDPEKIKPPLYVDLGKLK